MSLVHEFFTVLAEAIIPEFFRWVGTLVRWLILRNKYTMAEVYRQPWNARVGFTTILILTTVIIV